jgi:hypothetical protein
MKDRYDGAIIALWDDGTPKPKRIGVVRKITTNYRFQWLDAPGTWTLPLSREGIEKWAAQVPDFRKILCYADDELKLFYFKLKYPEWFNA